MHQVANLSSSFPATTELCNLFLLIMTFISITQRSCILQLRYCIQNTFLTHLSSL